MGITVRASDLPMGCGAPFYHWWPKNGVYITPRYRDWLFVRDNYQCRYCGVYARDEKSLSLDHWFPRRRGGSNKPDNVLTACMTCNLKKGGRIVHYRPRLRKGWEERLVLVFGERGKDGCWK